MPFFGEKALDRVRDGDVTRLIVRLRRSGRKPKTIRNVLSTLHSVFELAVRRRWVTANPCKLVDALTIALRLTRATADTVEQARRELREFWRDQGRLHFRVEEEVLLPAFAAYGDAYHPLIATTLCDHVAIRHRVDALLSGPEPAPSALHGLGVRLREHVRMEERKLFPLRERSVPSAALVALAVALQQAEREAL